MSKDHRPYANWLLSALKEAHYIEDVKALRHFVFHARLNMASDTCLLCGEMGCAEPPFEDSNSYGLWALGHAAGCEYYEAVRRVLDARKKGRETLSEYMDRI